MKYGIYASYIENADVHMLWVFENDETNNNDSRFEKVGEAKTKKAAADMINELCRTAAYISL